jgi:type IV secretion system protein TrbL
VIPPAAPADVCSIVPTIARGVCHAAAQVVSGGPASFLPSPAGLLGGIGNGILGGLTSALAAGSAWFVGKIADLLGATSDVHLSTGWFIGHYTRMVGVAAALTAVFLLLTAASAVVHRDPLRIGRAIPMVAVAGLGTGGVIAVTALLLAVSDALSQAVTAGTGTDLKTALAGASQALSHFGTPTDSGAAPIVVALLTGIITVAAGLLLWIELMLRQAAIYAGVLFFPIALAGLAWEPSRRWARRLVETVVALIFSKFVIAAVLSLAVGGLAAGHGDGAGAVLAGAGLLWVAALTPFLLMRLIGVLEVTVAASHLEGVRSRGTHTGVYYGQSAMYLARSRGTSAALPAAGAAAPYAAGVMAAGHLAHRAGQGPAAAPATSPPGALS